MFTFLTTLLRQSETRPSAFSMADPILGPFIHIFVDEKKNRDGEGYPARALRMPGLLLADGAHSRDWEGILACQPGFF